MRASRDTRWYALVVLSLGVLMTVLDSTIVNVALPTIKADLGFSDTALDWVANGYLLTFGGLLVLGGRLGDLYGGRLLFLIGVALFALASLGCGLATDQSMLILFRCIQGVSGAIINAVALSLIANLFPEAGERARAMGIYSCVCAGGGSVGLLLGGVLTEAFNWHWIFLINVPTGALVVYFCRRWLPEAARGTTDRSIDIAGAATVTAGLSLAVYAIVSGNTVGWTAAATLGAIALSAALLASFVAVELRVRSPLVPLGLFRLPNLAIANAVAVLWPAALFGWYFLAAIYMRTVVNFSALEIGLAFLPSNIIVAVSSLGLSAKVVMRFGIKAPLTLGLLLFAAGQLLFAFSAVRADGDFHLVMLATTILLGLGGSLAFNPMLIAALSDVTPDRTGLAAGIVNTSFMVGGALGIAVLTGLAFTHTTTLQLAGQSGLNALIGGYRAAFLASAMLPVIAAALVLLLFRQETRLAPATSNAAGSTP